MESTLAGDAVDEPISAQGGAGRALRRRGLVAGAAALIAGVVVPRATQSVSAGTDGDVVLGATNNTAATTRLNNTTASGGIALSLNADNGDSGIGLLAVGSFIGVSASSSGSFGVSGGSSSETGAGVEGVAQNNAGGTGVLGRSFSSLGVGVQGTSTSGTGVIGQTTTGTFGVHGNSDAPSGVGVGGTTKGGFGVIGTADGGSGVHGESNTGFGVVAFSQQNHGIVGQTARPFFGGIVGVATAANTVGLFGTTNNGAGNVAGAFAGFMDGNFVVAHGVKSAAVPHPDGSHRLVYCVESPENWFEDVGKANLVNGHADVKLDADFAAIVHTDDYHVFLTTYGASQGLDVMSQSATGFSVQEHNGGKGNLAFGYRVMAKRKDIAAKRLATFDLPGKIKQDLKIPQVPAPPIPPKPPADPRKP